MKIRGWSIDGFGHFHDYEVSGIGDGLTVFHGPNEAGKSTLLAFIRAMLFGFPDRRRLEPRYEPTRGGRHGGRLTLEVDGEAWSVQREAGARGGAGFRLFTPRGEGSEDDLRRALGSADAKLFRNVFAFSLTELQAFGTLDDDGLRSRILSAGIVGAGRAARQVIGKLGERADALYKSRGRSQVIPGLLKQLDERRAATAAARRAARAYPELLREEESSMEEKRRLEAAISAARQAGRRFEALLSLWSIWSDIRDAEGQYALLEAIDTFPSDPERRLADVSSHLEAVRSKCRDTRGEYEQASARVEAIRRDVRPELAEVGPGVFSLHETHGLYRSNLSRLQGAQRELDHATAELARALQSLGPGWTEERLAAFDASLPQRERIRAWSERIRRTADGVRAAESELSSATRQLQQADLELEEATGRLQATPAPESKRLEAREATLRRLHALLNERRDVEHHVARQRMVLEERTAALRALDAELQADAATEAELAPPAYVTEDGRGAGQGEPVGAAELEQGAPRGVSAWLAPIAVVVFGLLVAGALATIRPMVGLAVAALSVGAAVAVALWMRRVRGRAEAESKAAAERLSAAERAAAAAREAAARQLETAERVAAARRRARAERRDAAMARLSEASEASERALIEVQRLNAKTTEAAAVLGLSDLPNAEDLRDLERGIAEERQHLLRAEAARSAAADAELRRGRALNHAKAAELRHSEAQAAAAAELTGWRVWAEDAGLPGEMTPEAALDFVPLARQALDAQHSRDRLRLGIAALEAEVRAWEERAAELLSRAGMAPHEGHTPSRSLADALNALHTRCLEDRAARERLTAAGAELETWRGRLVSTAEQLSRCEEARAALLAEAGAETEAHYRGRMQTFEERERLRREIDRLRRQLTSLIGDDPEAHVIRATLATGAVGEWQRERERYESEVAALEQQLELAIRANHDAQRRREAVETSADIASCEAEEQALLTEIGQTIDQWRTLTLARALTEFTLREFVRTRQPAVVAKASAMFAEVTGGAYNAVRQDEDGEGLSVVTQRGEVLAPEQLSRGTAEQLYLCLRLGLAAEFATHGAELPLVMDDVCVNFDPERAGAIAAVLRDFAQGRQIIFFTCHPTTVDTVRAVIPEVDVRYLARHGGDGSGGGLEPEARAGVVEGLT